MAFCLLERNLGNEIIGTMCLTLGRKAVLHLAESVQMYTFSYNQHSSLTRWAFHFTEGEAEATRLGGSELVCCPRSPLFEAFHSQASPVLRRAPALGACRPGEEPGAAGAAGM